MAVTLDIIAYHEAGHAVMRWLRGLPAGELTATEDGGLCAGTGKRYRVEDLLLVTLAGYAAESGYGLVKFDLTDEGHDDFRKARAMLSAPGAEIWRCFPQADGSFAVASVEEAMVRWMERACEELCPHMEAVEALAMLLEEHRQLSSRRVAAVLREYGKGTGGR